MHNIHLIKPHSDRTTNACNKVVGKTVEETVHRHCPCGYLRFRVESLLEMRSGERLCCLFQEYSSCPCSEPANLISSFGTGPSAENNKIDLESKGKKEAEAEAHLFGQSARAQEVQVVSPN